MARRGAARAAREPVLFVGGLLLLLGAAGVWLVGPLGGVCAVVMTMPWLVSGVVLSCRRYGRARQRLARLSSGR